MPIFDNFFEKRSRWIEFETVYSIERMDSIRMRLADAQIPHKVRAALLPAGVNSVFSAARSSMWYLSVQEEDAGRAQRCIRAAMEESV